MKKLVLGVIFLMATISVSFGQLQFGAGLALALDNSNFGVHGKAKLPVSETLIGQGGFTYYFEKDNVKFWSLDADVHYKLMTIGENIILNPFAGLNITNINVSAGGLSSDSTEIGINLGASFLFPASESLDVFIEPKLVLEGIDGFVITAGVMF